MDLRWGENTWFSISMKRFWLSIIEFYCQESNQREEIIGLPRRLLVWARLQRWLSFSFKSQMSLEKLWHSFLPPWVFLKVKQQPWRADPFRVLVATYPGTNRNQCRFPSSLFMVHLTRPVMSQPGSVAVGLGQTLLLPSAIWNLKMLPVTTVSQWVVGHPQWFTMWQKPQRETKKHLGLQAAFICNSCFEIIFFTFRVSFTFWFPGLISTASRQLWYNLPQRRWMNVNISKNFYALFCVNTTTVNNNTIHMKNTLKIWLILNWLCLETIKIFYQKLKLKRVKRICFNLENQFCLFITEKNMKIKTINHLSLFSVALIQTMNKINKIQLWVGYKNQYSTTKCEKKWPLFKHNISFYVSYWSRRHILLPFFFFHIFSSEKKTETVFEHIHQHYL